MTASACVRETRAGYAWVLALRQVTRSYAGRRVLGPVDLALAPGTVCLVGGANGAGKTTLLRVAAGLLAPTTGTRRCPHAGSALYLRPGAGSRAEQTVGQALSFAGRMTDGRGLSAAVALEMVGLVGQERRRVAALSGGQRARLTVAVALVTGPGLVCLDEPSNHLDDAGLAGIRQAMAFLAASGSALLVASHDPDGFADLADASVWLRAGWPEVRG